MPLTTFSGESSLTALVRRHFDISGRGSVARIREVEAELLHANPHLSNIGQVPPGTPIVLPEIPELRPPRERPAESPAEAAHAVVLEHMRGALDGLRSALDT